MDETTVIACGNYTNPVLRNIHEIALERAGDVLYMASLINDLNPDCEMCRCCADLWDDYISRGGARIDYVGPVFCGICISLAVRSSCAQTVFIDPDDVYDFSPDMQKTQEEQTGKEIPEGPESRSTTS